MLWAVFALGSCAPARTILQQADLTPTAYAPAKLDNPQASFADLENAIFGQFNDPTVFELKSSETLSTDWLDGRATVERRVYAVSHGQTPQRLEYIFVTPTNAPDVPLIITQNFTSNRAVVAKKKKSPLPGEGFSMGPLGGVFKYFFGRHIVEHPYEDILDRGYGVIAVHPPAYVPDLAKQGNAQLNKIFGDRPDRPGALTVWASLTTELAKQLKADKPNRPIIAYGHSRYGKTALLAAAYSPAIDGAIAHQSGTAGRDP